MRVFAGGTGAIGQHGVGALMRTKAWRDNDRVRTEGSAAIVDAALAAGVDRARRPNANANLRAPSPTSP